VWEVLFAKNKPVFAKNKPVFDRLFFGRKCSFIVKTALFFGLPSFSYFAFLKFQFGVAVLSLNAFDI